MEIAHHLEESVYPPRYLDSQNSLHTTDQLALSLSNVTRMSCGPFAFHKVRTQGSGMLLPD